MIEVVAFMLSLSVLLTFSINLLANLKSFVVS